MKGIGDQARRRRKARRGKAARKSVAPTSPRTPKARAGAGAPAKAAGSKRPSAKTPPDKARPKAAGKTGGAPGKPARPRTTSGARKRTSPKRRPDISPGVGVDQDRFAQDVAHLLAAIVDSSNAAIIGKTPDGIVTSWNRSAERIFGYTAAEIVGQPIDVIAPPERAQDMAAILDQVRRGRRIEQHETERRRKDGTIVQVSLSVSPIYDAAGRLIGATKIAHDITSQKRTEAQLRAKSERLEEFAHLLDLAPAMVRTLDGEILFWGRGLEALYGWSPEEAVGQSAHRLLATEFPGSLAEIQAELLETGEWQGELVHRHRDGHRIVVASHWALHRDRAGNPVSMLKLDWDVTEAKRAQSMVEEREARLRSILETSPSAIITIDERGIVQSFSDAAEKLFGYAAGEVIGHNVKMLMPSPHRESHDGYLERYLRTGERRIIGVGRMVEALRKDGSTLPIELAVGEVKIGASRIFTGFIRDLTSLVKMEQDLRQAQKMEAIGQLTGGIAHDFNNLLTVISGNLEILERQIERPDQREILNEAQEASQLGAELAKRLLAFGRRQSLRPRPTDLNALIDGMIDLLRRSLGATVEIETRLAAGLPMIMVDPGQVENALLNLAVNARDAMPDGGRVVVETGWAVIDNDYAVAYGDIVPGGYVTLAVTDTGGGMAPEVRQRAFEPFYTTKGPGAGTGLGLSMVYGFVKQSGGHVQLYSEVGYGTTVRLYLPARAEAAQPAMPRESAARARGSVDEVVLVVEDDPRVRRVSVRRLQELGYTVLEAESGPAALTVLDAAGRIDLLFTDIVMAGGMTGVDLARLARQRRPELKILFTSGYAEPAVIKDGMLTAHAGWLGKPYGIRELDAKLRDLLDR